MSFFGTYCSVQCVLHSPQLTITVLYCHHYHVLSCAELFFLALSCTVSKANVKVQHPEQRVEQEHNWRASKKDSEIPIYKFSIYIKIFRQTFTNVEILQQRLIVSKAAPLGANLHPQVYNLILNLCGTFSYLLWGKCGVANWAKNQHGKQFHQEISI